MISIVTVEREYGCGGGEIAQRLAEVLGWKLWDHLLTEEIARLANCSQAAVAQREERTDPLYYRLFKSFLRGSYDGSINAHKLNLVDSENIAKMTERVVQHAAAKGNCVIVGRGSQLFLKDRADTLRVFLYAPTEEKVRRLLARGKSEKEARELVDTVDRAELWQVQTPQAFQAALLWRAYQEAMERGFYATDEAALVEALGETVVVVPGTCLNLKITTPDDLKMAEAILAFLKTR
jgi:cytidylate kinase